MVSLQWSGWGQLSPSFLKNQQWASEMQSKWLLVSWPVLANNKQRGLHPAGGHVCRVRCAMCGGRQTKMSIWRWVDFLQPGNKHNVRSGFSRISRNWKKRDISPNYVATSLKCATLTLRGKVTRCWASCALALPVKPAMLLRLLPGLEKVWQCQMPNVKCHGIWPLAGRLNTGE